MPGVKTSLGLVSVLVLAVTFAGAQSSGPEDAAKKIFDKAVADADAARKRAVLVAYKAYETRMNALIGTAKRANKTDRVTDLQNQVDEVKKGVTDMGVTIPGSASQAQFQTVMDRFCVRCHPVCKSVAQQKQRGWIMPGRPEQSKTFTVIGVNKRSGGTYHNVPDAERQVIYDYIRGGAVELSAP